MKYIYESPDGGKTVYRHPIGHPDRKELVGQDDDPIVIEGLMIDLPADIKRDLEVLNKVDKFLNRNTK